MNKVKIDGIMKNDNRMIIEPLESPCVIIVDIVIKGKHGSRSSEVCGSHGHEEDTPSVYYGFEIS